MSEDRVTEKVYCYDHPSAYNNHDALAIAAIAQLTSLQTEIYNEADEQVDYVTADLMTQLSKWCEFNSWFLVSITGKNSMNV